jgi:hypothetical protein
MVNGSENITYNFYDLNPDLAFNVLLTQDSDLRLTFTNAVPIPPALWLFGSGLLGLIGIARRKKAA